MAGNDKVIIRQCLQSNEPIPDKIANAPTVPDHLELYWHAYLDLDTTRAHNMGPTPISIIDMLHYCRYYNLDDDQSDALIYIVRVMDLENLKRISKRIESKAR